MKDGFRSHIDSLAGSAGGVARWTPIQRQPQQRAAHEPPSGLVGDLSRPDGEPPVGGFPLSHFVQKGRNCSCRFSFHQFRGENFSNDL